MHALFSIFNTKTGHVKKSCLSSALSFAIVFPVIIKLFSQYCSSRSLKSSSSVLIPDSWSLMLNTWTSILDPPFSIVSRIEYRVKTQLTFEQYCLYTNVSVYVTFSLVKYHKYIKNEVMSVVKGITECHAVANILKEFAICFPYAFALIYMRCIHLHCTFNC